MELKKLTPHVYFSEPERETDRPVLGYIVGSDKAVMVDAGNSKAHGEAYRALSNLDFETAIPGHSEPLSKEQLLSFLGSFM